MKKLGGKFLFLHFLFLGVFALTLLIPEATSAQTSGNNSVDLIYQTKTYTPPFYKGKALPSSESLVEIIAVPSLTLKNGGVGRAENLNFTWKKNSKVLGENSGKGRNILSIKTGRLPGDSDIIEVIVSGEDGTSAETTMALQGFSPSVSFYLNDPVLGIRLEKAMGASFSLRESEASVVAYPYFFEVTDRNSPIISYSWSLGGVPANPRPNAPSEIILRRGEDTGSINLSLSINNSSKILEAAGLSTIISFLTGSQAPF